MRSDQLSFAFLLVAVVPWLASGFGGVGWNCPQAWGSASLPLCKLPSPSGCGPTCGWPSFLVSWPGEDLCQYAKQLEEVALGKETQVPRLITTFGVTFTEDLGPNHLRSTDCLP